MDKMYQAVRDFVSPFICSVSGSENVIVGTERETVFSPSIKVGYAHTLAVKKRGWECTYLSEIKSIRKYPMREGGEDICALAVEVLDYGHPELSIIDSKSTIFIQMYLDKVDKDIILMALDLETLETYIVNEVV